jgi:hypothetical protein
MVLCCSIHSQHLSSCLLISPIFPIPLLFSFCPRFFSLFFLGLIVPVSCERSELLAALHFWFAHVLPGGWLAGAGYYDVPAPDAGHNDALDPDVGHNDGLNPDAGHNDALDPDVGHKCVYCVKSVVDSFGRAQGAPVQVMSQQFGRLVSQIPRNQHPSIITI